MMQEYFHIKENDLIVIGEILKPHGVKGQLKIKYYGESQKDFLKIKKFFIKESIKNDWRPYTVKLIKPFNKYFIMTLDGICSFEKAEELRKKELFIEKKSLKLLSLGEYFCHQIIGLKVYNDKEEIIGEIKSIIPTKGHDIYVIKSEKEEVMIPAVPYFIKEINVSKKFIKLNSKAGILNKC